MWYAAKRLPSHREESSHVVSQSIAYHFVREGSARDEWRTAYVNTHLNPADLLTKPLASGEKRTGFVRMILQHLFGAVD